MIGLVGFTFGVLSVVGVMHLRTHKDTAADLRSVGDEQAFVAAVSLSVLDKLESGDTDRAKFLLAQQVASYYTVFRKLQSVSSAHDHLVDRIESTRERSLALRHALGEKSP